MQHSPTRSRACATLSVTLAVACGSQDGTPLPTTTPLLMDAAAVSEVDAGCSVTRCSCGALPGLTGCDSAGHATACQCSIPPPSSGPTARCSPGVYRGTFEGVGGTFGVPLVPLSGFDALSEAPGLELTLAEEGGAEFRLVGNGTLQGVVNGFVPFMGTIKGELDCAARTFTGEATGAAEALIAPLGFAGHITAAFDAEKQALVDGHWKVGGPPPPDSGLDVGAVAEITWSASLVDVRDGGLRQDGGP